jgi:hypothetical protein
MAQSRFGGSGFIRLPEALEQRFRDERYQYEEGWYVKYTTCFERLARKEGRKAL